MITSNKHLIEYCKEYWKIENYVESNNSKDKWDLHHRLELTLDGEYAHNYKELIRLGMYYDRPYFELIFLPRNVHQNLHKRTEYSRKQISKGKKGCISSTRGKPRSIFGIKFKEHYGITKSDNEDLYNKERSYYLWNKKCSWE